MRKVMAAVAALCGATSLLPVRRSARLRSRPGPTKTVTIVVPYSPGGGTRCRGRPRCEGARRDVGPDGHRRQPHRRQRLGRCGPGGARRARRAHAGAGRVGHRDQRPSHEAALRHRDRLRAASPPSPILVATLLATPDLPANDLKELQALVKKEGPDKRTSASPDPGSRLMAERIFDSAGIKLLNVPLQGRRLVRRRHLRRPRRCRHRQRHLGPGADQCRQAEVARHHGHQAHSGAAQHADLQGAGLPGARTRIPGTACSRRPARRRPPSRRSRRTSPPCWRGPTSRPSWSITDRCPAAIRQRLSASDSSATSRSRARRSAGSASPPIEEDTMARDFPRRLDRRRGRGGHGLDLSAVAERRRRADRRRSRGGAMPGRSTSRSSTGTRRLLRLENVGADDWPPFREVRDGRAMALVKNLPREGVTPMEFRLMTWAIGLHFGVARPQNRTSDYITEVKDTGHGLSQPDRPRLQLQGRARLHVDGSDVVLRCYNQAPLGGMSMCSSAATAFDVVGRASRLCRRRSRPTTRSAATASSPKARSVVRRPVCTTREGRVFCKVEPQPHPERAADRGRAAAHRPAARGDEVFRHRAAPAGEHVLHAPGAGRSPDPVQPDHAAFAHQLRGSRRGRRKRTLYRLGWRGPIYGACPTAGRVLRHRGAWTVRGGMKGHQYDDVRRSFGTR